MMSFAIPPISYAFIAYLLLLWVATGLADAPYSWLGDTVSRLGSQGFPRAWIMRLAFVLLGGSSVVQAISLVARLGRRPAIILSFAPLAVYGICIVLTAVFSEGAGQGAQLNSEAIWHQRFAQIAGAAFFVGLACASYRLRAPLYFSWLSAAVFAVGCAASLLFFVAPQYQGLWQRILHHACVAWFVALSFARAE